MIPTTHGIVQQKQVAAAFISVLPTSLDFPFLAGTQTFAITASGSWTLAESPAVTWLNTGLVVSGTGNRSISVTVTKNLSGLDRYTTLILTQGSLEATVTIVQRMA